MIRGKEAEAKTISIPRNLKLSQLAALCLAEPNAAYPQEYMDRLRQESVDSADALKLFRFDCGVICRWGKRYLREPNFASSWCFDLKHRAFAADFMGRGDMLRERFFTISELGKLICEAEWHYWSSYVRDLPEDVWQEICDWRLKGPGGDFAVQYIEMIAQATGVPAKRIAAICASEM